MRLFASRSLSHHVCVPLGARDWKCSCSSALV